MVLFMMRAFFKSLFIIALLPFVLAACAGTPQKAATQINASNYTLGAGDKIRLIVYGNEELSGEFTVDSSGHVSLPLVKDMNVKGLTSQQLELQVTNALKPKYLKDPKVSVEILNYRDIYVLGEVRVPGKYPYISNMTYLQAVAIAGGYTYRAEESNAEITRPENGRIVTFLIDGNSVIKPGDTIVIKRRWF